MRSIRRPGYRFYFTVNVNIECEIFEPVNFPLTFNLFIPPFTKIKQLLFPIITP